MICRHLRTTRIELYHHDELHFVFDRASFPHLGIWKQKDSPFLCIEPWHGFADLIDVTGNLLDKPGIFALEPYESRDFAWFISIP